MELGKKAVVRVQSMKIMLVSSQLQEKQMMPEVYMDWFEERNALIIIMIWKETTTSDEVFKS